MARLNTLQGVLHNFLSTFTNRYAEYQGYWLFGMLTKEMAHLQIDLLSSPVPGPEVGPLAAARLRARTKFLEQMEKSGLSLSLIHEAYLSVSQPTQSTRDFVNGQLFEGHRFTFTARAVSTSNRVFEDQLSVFVAPHDPRREFRSTRI